MQLDNFDLVASLQALPETDPIEIDGVQFGDTCTGSCTNNTVQVQTVCAVIAVTCT